MKSWKRVEPTDMTKVGWRTIVSKTFVLPDGQQGVFETFGKEGQAYVATIALTIDNQVIVARQFRPGPERLFDELPGGAVEAGESPEVAARRELREETGYKAGELRYVGGYHKDAYTNGFWHVFYATQCVYIGKQRLDIGEYVDVVLVSKEQLRQNAKSGYMTDATAVLMAQDML